MKSFTAITTHSQLFYQTFLSLRFWKTENKATENKAKQNKKRESRNPNNCVYFNSFLPSWEIPCPTLLPKYLSLIHQYDQHTELYITTLSLTFFFSQLEGEEEDWNWRKEQIDWIERWRVRAAVWSRRYSLRCVWWISKTTRRKSSTSSSSPPP